MVYNYRKNIQFILALVYSSFYLKISISEGLNKGSDSLCGEIIVVRLVFGHVLSEGDETDSRALLSLKSEEFQDSGIILITGVKVDEKDLKKKWNDSAYELKI